MNHAEDDLQIAVVEMLRLSPDIRVFAVPNGGKRNAREAARLHKACVLPGVSDLVVAWEPAQIAFIELKAPGKVTGKARPLDSLSAPQFAWFGFCQLAKFNVMVCDSVECVEMFLRKCGAPLRPQCRPYDNRHNLKIVPPSVPNNDGRIAV